MKIKFLILLLLFQSLCYSLETSMEDFSLLLNDKRVYLLGEIVLTLKEFYLSDSLFNKIDSNKFENHITFLNDSISLSIPAYGRSSSIYIIEIIDENLKTNRGIKIGDNKNKILNMYPYSDQKLIINTHYSDYILINCVLKDGKIADDPMKIKNSFYPEDYESLTISYKLENDKIIEILIYRSFDM